MPEAGGRLASQAPGEQRGEKVPHLGAQALGSDGWGWRGGWGEGSVVLSRTGQGVERVVPAEGTRCRGPEGGTGPSRQGELRTSFQNRHI